jgi:hypothetical protein
MPRVPPIGGLARFARSRWSRSPQTAWLRRCGRSSTPGGGRAQRWIRRPRQEPGVSALHRQAQAACQPRPLHRLGANRLLGLVAGVEGHDDRRPPGRDEIEHRVVAGLADRQRAAGEQRRKIRPRPLDDHMGGRGSPQSNAKSASAMPRPTRSASLAPRAAKRAAAPRRAPAKRAAAPPPSRRRRR